MSMEESGRQLGALAIEHFSNPANRQADDAIEKILAETRAEDLSSLLRQANSQAGKVSISPEYDKCNAINKVDFTFHPLFSLRPLGKDISISASNVAECTPKPHKR